MSETKPEPAPRGESFVGIRRTELAEERTYLAWLRSALAAFAVGLAVGKVVPSITRAARWPYLTLGIAFALLGLVMAAYGLWRQVEVSRAVAAGSYAPLDRTAVATVTAATVLLGTLLVIVLVSD